LIVSDKKKDTRFTEEGTISLIYSLKQINQENSSNGLTKGGSQMFKEHNAHPKGLKTSDCVVRAIATATNTDYMEVR
jgi:hypothetical protein